MKKQGATIENWQFHYLYPTMEQAQKRGMDIQIDEVLMFTGTVVVDPSGKFQPDHHMRSSIICKYDPETGICETQNTVYVLLGEEGGD